MATITVTQLRAAIEKQRSTLSRQQSSVDATLGLIAMLEHQLEQLQGLPERPAKK